MNITAFNNFKKLPTNKKIIFSLGLMFISNTILTRVINSKKSAVTLGFSLGTVSVVSAVYNLKQTSNSIKTGFFSKLRSNPEVSSMEAVIYYLAENVVSGFISQQMSYISNAPFSGEKLANFSVDETPLCLYILVGLVGGIVAGLIFSKTQIGLNKDDVIKVVKNIPKALLSLYKHASGKAKLNDKIISIIILVYLSYNSIFSLKDFVTILKSIIKRKDPVIKDSIKKITTQDKNKLKVFKKVSLNLKGFMKINFILQQLKNNVKISPQFFNKMFKNSFKAYNLKTLSKVSDKVKDNVIKNIINGYNILIDRLKQQGLKLNIPIYVSFDFSPQDANAFYNSVGNYILYIPTSSAFKSFTSEEIAATFSHELGHAVNHSYERYLQLPLVIVYQIVMIIIAFNKKFFIKYAISKKSVEQTYIFLLSYLDTVMTNISREDEMSADSFAIKLGLGTALSSGIKKFTPKEYMNLSSDQADCHDITARRIKAIEDAIQILKNEQEFKKYKL